MTYLIHRWQQLPLDLRTTTWLQGIRFDPFADMMVAISLLGYYPQNVVLVGLVAIVFGAWLSWRGSLFLVSLTAFQGLVNHVLKTVIGRPRPAESLVEVLLPRAGMSFPSGHVMFYTVFFGFLGFLLWTRLAGSPVRVLLLAASAVLVLLVGPSRIYLGAHWVSDVIAGYMVGLLSLTLGIELYVHLVRRQHRQSQN